MQGVIRDERRRPYPTRGEKDRLTPIRREKMGLERNVQEVARVMVRDGAEDYELGD